MVMPEDVIGDAIDHFVEDFDERWWWRPLKYLLYFGLLAILVVSLFEAGILS